MIPRSPFVGRESERSLLASLFEEASRGQGALVLLGGEPGVGKTRLSEEAASDARDHGFRCLRGHCYDGESGTPYLPFVEMVTEMARTVPPAELREALDDVAAEVARLAPALRRVFPDLAKPVDAPPEEGRRLLFNAVSALLERSARKQPLVLLFDDLHWADASTLALIQHISQHVAGLPILVIATYRDDELAANRPLAKMLEELVRRRLAHDLVLRRLSEESVAQMLRAYGPGVPPAPLVSLVHRETDGNPFFVEELVRHLAEEGKLIGPHGGWVADTILGETDVPRTVRLVIERRLERVSGDCRQMLAEAAVVGREFGFTVLEAMGSLRPGALLDAVEEAERAVLVRDVSRGTEARYAFTHELVRQALLAGISLPRRQRLHSQVAETIERVYERTLDGHVDELVYHFRCAGPAGDAEKATDYTLRAAGRAAGVFAWGEAARLYETVLESPESAPILSPGRRCDVLLQLGDVQFELWENERTLERTAPEAYRLAVNGEDLGQTAHACWLAVRAIFARFAYPGLGRPDYVDWTSKLDRAAMPGTIHRVRADLALARLSAFRRQPEETDDRCRRAMDLAREIDAPLDLVFAIGWCHLFYCGGPRYAATRRAIGRDLASLLSSRAQDGPANVMVGTLIHVAAEALERGARDEFDRLADLLVQVSSRADPRVGGFGLETRDALVGCLDGELGTVVAAVESLIRNASEGPSRGVPSAAYGWMFSLRPRLQLGDPSVPAEDGDGPTDWALRPLELATAGRRTEALQMLERTRRAAGREASGAPDGWNTWMLVMWLETAVLLKDQELARWFAAPLWDDPTVTTGLAHTTMVRRHLAGAAALLGQPARPGTLSARARRGGGAQISSRGRPHPAGTR